MNEISATISVHEHFSRFACYLGNDFRSFFASLLRHVVILGAIVCLLIGRAEAQAPVGADPLANDKAKQTNDKGTLKEDQQEVTQYMQQLQTLEQQLLQERASIETAQAKQALAQKQKRPDPALDKLIKDEQAQAAVTEAYVQRYQNYLSHLQYQVQQDKSVLQQDSIDQTADDASNKLSQEQQVLQANLDPYANRYAPDFVPIAGEPLPGYADPYGNPAYVTPYLGGTWGYGDGPDYGYGGRSWGWGHPGWGTPSGRTPTGLPGGNGHYPGSPSPIERGGGVAHIENSGGRSGGGGAVASGGRR
jgi:hypothetical protein